MITGTRENSSISTAARDQNFQKSAKIQDAGFGRFAKSAETDQKRALVPLLLQFPLREHFVQNEALLERSSSA